jgi:uncharacterized membrane protein YbaN (DUF454 family)
MKKYLWMCLGFISLGVAYLGVILPGLPYSPFIVFAAYCFAKSSPRLHNWIMNHRIFGKFLNDWNTKRVFPLKLKFFMLASMTTSLVLMYTGGVPTRGIIYTAIFMLCVAIWAWRYPSSPEEHDRRIAEGKKVGWFNNNF